MTKREKGHMLYRDDHPKRPGTTDTAGHQKLRGAGAVVNKETKELLENQVSRLNREFGIG